jgi:adenine-specific DNA-methyltransferase
MAVQYPSGVSESRSRWLDQSAESELFLDARDLAQRAAASRSGHARRALAEEFSLSTIAAYWRALQRPYGQRWRLPALLAARTSTVLDASVARVAQQIGEAAADLDPATASYLIGRNYTVMLPEDLRSRLGVYYTPPLITGRLLDAATAAGVNWRYATIVDPACGGGAFLAPVAARIVAEMKDCNPRTVIASVAKRLRGLEVDGFAAWTSQVFIEATMLQLCRAASMRSPVIVEVCDSLERDSLCDRFDLVIGNPPYGRITPGPDARARYRRSLYGHANRYGLFTDLALRLVRRGGVVAYVTPTSFLAGEYFKRLRGLLAREASPVNIDFVAARKGVFDDVLQETVLTTYRRKPGDGPSSTGGLRPPDEAARVHLVDCRAGALDITAAGRFSPPSDPEKPWLIPRTPSHTAIVHKMARFSHSLADYGYAVSTGPLVWNRHKPQLCSEQSEGALPLIWAESVTPSGAFIFKATKRNHAPFFRPKAGDEWLLNRRPCVLLQRTTAKEQGRRLVAAELPASFIAKYGAVVVENHLNMIRPLNGTALAPSVLTAFLNSRVVDQAFRCVNGSVAVSAFELESLPLPPPASLQAFAALVQRGAARAELDRACADLFGLAEAA